MADDDEYPSVIWIPAEGEKRNWPILRWVFIGLLCVQCLVRIAIAREQGGDFLRILLAETFSDPLFYIWGVLSMYGSDKVAGKPLRFRCPHCGDTGKPSDSLLKGMLGGRWKCGECQNLFIKSIGPPTQ